MNTVSDQQVIRAEISNKFFEIVDRLFDNSPRTVCAELIQNARRANATTVDFNFERLSFERVGDGLPVIVTDDGDGIKNMADLLRIRGSGWSEETRSKEDPAGMGFFCLCRMNNLTVRSKARQVFLGEACEALKGVIDAVVESTDAYVDGTQIEFDWPLMTAHQLRDAITVVGRHAPIKVTIDGSPIVQDSIRPTSVLSEFENDDVKVYIHRGGYGARLVFNFHGLIVDDEFPQDIKDFCAIVDVKDTSKLQMVLPARNAIVHNVYYSELLEEIQRRIYDVIKHENSHSLPYRRWEDARLLGIDLPPATQKLKTWKSSVSRVNIDDSRTNLVMNRGSSRGKFESLAAALEGDDQFCLYEEDVCMEGYEWYDAIQKVTSIQYEQDGEIIERISGVKSVGGLGISVTLDWNHDEPIVFKAPILIGRVGYGDENYNSAISRAGGFYIDPECKWDEDDICKLIDTAWQNSYISNSNKKEWNRQRTLDVRRCIGDAAEALEYTLLATIQDAFSAIDNLASYAGSVVTVKCSVDDEGKAKIERI